MKKNENKYLYTKVLQGWFDPESGWDYMCEYNVSDPEQMRELRSDLKSYRENDPDHDYRVIRRRVPNPNYRPS